MNIRPPKRVRRIIPKPHPLLLLPAWRVVPVALEDVRANRVRALARATRKRAALLPVELVYADEGFRARVEAIVARRVQSHALAGT